MTSGENEQLVVQRKISRQEQSEYGSLKKYRGKIRCQGGVSILLTGHTRRAPNFISVIK